MFAKMLWLFTMFNKDCGNRLNIIKFQFVLFVKIQLLYNIQWRYEQYERVEVIESSTHDSHGVTKSLQSQRPASAPVTLRHKIEPSGFSNTLSLENRNAVTHT